MKGVHMSGSRFLCSIMIAGFLTGFAGPLCADDLSQSAPPANTTHYENSSGVIGVPTVPQVAPYGQPVNQQQTSPREPVYVWQGNHIGSPGLGSPGLPHAVDVAGVRYITGGIGDEERDALEAVKGEYNLHVTCTNNNGEFNGDMLVTIFDKKGQALLNVEAGPLFYANLPAGTYTVKATSGGQSEEHKVTVGDNRKSSSVYFRW